MTLEMTIQKSLTKWRPAERSGLHIADPANRWSITITADKCDELGVKIWEVAVRRLGSAEDATLKSWSTGIAERGLSGDPLKVVEMDDDRNEALIRNRTPTESDNYRLYYEILVKGTSETIVRHFQARSDGLGKRQQIGFVLTHASAARLVGSLLDRN